MEAESDSVKKVVLPEKRPTLDVSNHVVVTTPRTPKPRVITQEKRWVLRAEDYVPERQWKALFEPSIPEDEKIGSLAKQQIGVKIAGYRAQDTKNGVYDAEQFVNLAAVLNLLKTSQMTCFYCRERVQVLYEHVREPHQWTLERLDNSRGHNTSNVVVACLNCNLRRRCIYHERYVFTKQLRIVKSGV